MFDGYDTAEVLAWMMEDQSRTFQKFIAMKRDECLVEQKEQQDIEDMANVSINNLPKVIEKCPIVPEKVTEKADPHIEYDKYQEYRFKLHMPEMFILFDLVNCEIRRSPKKTDRVTMMIHLRKKLNRRLIGYCYSFDPFDRRGIMPWGGRPEKEHPLIADQRIMMTPQYQLIKNGQLQELARLKKRQKELDEMQANNNAKRLEEEQVHNENMETLAARRIDVENRRLLFLRSMKPEQFDELVQKFRDDRQDSEMRNLRFY